MRRDTLYYASVMALFGLLEPSAAFCPELQRMHPQEKSTSVALNLVPGQGNQLVAAYNAATCRKETEDNLAEQIVSATNAEDEETALDHTRTFVQRAFSLPSHMRHPHPKIEGGVDVAEKKVDIVRFPLVGFTFCRNGDRVVPLPTQSNVSCRLPSTYQKNQEIFGWFNPVCKLDLYSEDPCHAPVDEPTKEQ